MVENPKSKILIVDDDPLIRSVLKTLLSGQYTVIEASNYNDAIQTFSKHDISLAILDVFLEDDKSGLDVLLELRRLNNTLPVMMLSNSSDLDTVVKCIRFGACDYISKMNLDNKDELYLRIRNCLKKELEYRTIKTLEKEFDENHPVIFESKAMKQILQEVELIDDMNILIEGETGVGKTPVARYANSLAAKRTNSLRPFVRINCAGLSRERLQADLFGHRKGAFTGAVTDNKGLVELAKDGDLFMDEVGDMDPACQSELLTFLDNGEYRRLGDPVTRHSNCRIIAATNTKLKDRVEKGLFRKDLYSRLAQSRFFIPSLRERKEDIKPIMEYYIEKYSGHKKPYTHDVLDIYLKHDWTEGNIRELRDAVKYMCVKAKSDDEINLTHLNSGYYCFNKNVGDIVIDSASMKNSVIEMGYDNYIDNIERMILDKLAKEEKSIKGLSTKIKTSDVTLWRKFKKYNITVNS
ncbi:MAG: sigma-54 dependent transcriptional regulator [Proteobacteria bacterium]|nr:sigma-54 dependent transcriptional regulator [Pseudomonadota bacterium]